MNDKEARAPWRVAIGVVVCVAVGLPLAIWVVLALQDQQAIRENVRLAAQTPEPLWTGSPPSAASFEPMYAVPRQPPVEGFEVLAAQEADRVLQGDELVIGVDLEGQSRAYPINMLMGPTREIINDKIGGTLIATTW